MCARPQNRFIMLVRLTSIILLLILLCNFSAHVVNFNKLKDARLCGNGADTEVSNEQCIDHSSDRFSVAEHKCDVRRFTPDRCLEAVVDTDSFSVESLEALLPNLDVDFSIRKIVVHVGSQPSIIDIGKETDKFLLSRLWWSVVDEPFSWKNTNHIVFIRAHHQIEHALHIMSAQQYPASESVCATTPMLLIHREFTGHDWYDRLALRSNYLADYPYAVHSVYAQQSDTKGECAKQSSAENKWECLFLPTTNCSLPRMVLDCHASDCLPNIIDDLREGTALFTAAEPDAKVLRQAVMDLPPTDPARIQYYSALLRLHSPGATNIRLREAVSAAKNHKTPKMNYRKPLNPEQVSYHTAMQVNIDLYTHNLLLRPAVAFRSRVAHLIHNFRTESHLAPHDRCVVAHIHNAKASTCVPSPLRDCEVQVDVSRVSLINAIDHAQALVGENARILLVSTFDDAWLEKQIEAARLAHPQWRVLNTRFHTQTSHSKEGDSSSTSAPWEGEMLHAAIELSHQCEAIVGDFDKPMTVAAYESMCAHHQHRENICPKASHLA